MFRPTLLDPCLDADSPAPEPWELPRNTPVLARESLANPAATRPDRKVRTPAPIIARRAPFLPVNKRPWCGFGRTPKRVRHEAEMQTRANDVCSEPIGKLTTKLSRHAAQIEVEVHGRFFVQGIDEVVPIKQVVAIERKFILSRQPIQLTVCQPVT
jgi:hypothetical protein